MAMLLRTFVCGIFLAAIICNVTADDGLNSLRESVLRVLEDPNLNDTDRFRELRTVIDEHEATIQAESAKEWVQSLSSNDFEVRNDARERLAEVGQNALPALEEGARSGDPEVSASCLQLIDRLARSDASTEDALRTLERLAKDDSQFLAARALKLQAATKKFLEQRTRQGVIDRLVSVGCRVDYDENAPGRPVRRISISGGGGFNDDLMSCITAFPQLEYLHLHRASITDAGMVHVASLRNLRHLSLSHSAISDNGLAHIADLTEIEDLAIDDTKVTDDGLQYLMKLDKLEELRLTRTQVTDSGLLRLKSFANLKSLGLGMQGKVTDDGLSILQEFPSLTRLTLSTDFTDRGVKHLAGLDKLERIAFISCKGVTDSGLRALSSVKTLKHLSIYSASNGITESGLAELKSAIPGLEIGGMR